MVADVHFRTVGTKAGFHPRAAPSESPEMKRMVAVAVARAKQGDRNALRFLYVRYSDNVYGYVRSIVHDDHEAEDITQIVFAKLMTVLVKYDQHAVPFLGWLLRLSRNAAIDYLRTRRAYPTEEVYCSDERFGDDMHERSRSLQAALAALPEEQRSVVLLRHVVGLTPREIAERLGRTDSSVHGLHHRGRRALQAELTRLGAAPSTPSTTAAA